MTRILCFLLFITISFSTVSVNNSSLIDSLHNEIETPRLYGNEEQDFLYCKQHNSLCDSLYIVETLKACGRRVVYTDT